MIPQLSTINKGSPKLDIWYENIKRDNLGINARHLEPVIRRRVLPQIKKEFRTTKLPSGLNDQELKYLERVLLAKGGYLYSALVESAIKYESVKSAPLWSDRIGAFKHPYAKSTTYKLDLSLERNRISLKRNGGLPTMLSKRLSLDGARQWNDTTVKPNPVLENCYGSVIGYRTQQPSAKGEVKVRDICMIPTHIWLLQGEAADSAINNTIENVSTKNEIMVLYVDPRKIREWYDNFSSAVTCWANIDAEAFNKSVTPEENVATAEYFYPNYEFKDLLIEYSNRSDLLLPDRVISRYGGKDSGSKTTNLDEGYVNIQDLLEVFERMRLLKYVVCILVNGDDISIGFSTKITQANLDKMAEFSRRTINSSKSVADDYLWNSKWYCDDDYLTRPIFRVLNSLMYSERRKDSIYGSKEMIEIITSQILEGVETHPLGHSLIGLMASITKYHISTMSDEQIREAASYLLEDQAWRQIKSVDEMIASIRSSEYAQTKV